MVVRRGVALGVVVCSWLGILELGVIVGAWLGGNGTLDG